MVKSDVSFCILLDCCVGVQINAGGVGFYRTVYPQNMLDALLPAIKNQSLPPRDRLGLQNDLFALVCICASQR